MRPPSHARGTRQRYEMVGCGLTGEALWGVTASWAVVVEGGWVGGRAAARPCAA